MHRKDESIKLERFLRALDRQAYSVSLLISCAARAFELISWEITLGQPREIFGFMDSRRTQGAQVYLRRRFYTDCRDSRQHCGQ